MNRPGQLIRGATILIDDAERREGWKSFQFKFVEFGDYEDLEGNDWLETPRFFYRGHEWSLKIYPRGDGVDNPATLSAFLVHHLSACQTSLSIKFEIKILDKFGAKKKAKTSKRPFPPELTTGHGFSLMLLSDIFDESQNMLDSNLCSLTIAVAIEEPPAAAYVPKNPFQDKIQNKFLDEESSDVCFEVSTVEPNEDNSRRARSMIPFHAHRFILEICAPMLAELFGEESSVVSINDIKPDVFHQMLWYVYGGTVPPAPLKEHAKDIIDAADKFSIVNLKLEAEAAYVKSTKISADNVMDNLLYADAKNLAVLKEAAMDFLAARGGEVLGNNISFDNFPPQLVRDLLVATTRSRNEGEGLYNNGFITMRVSELRRKLHEKGLGMNVDGSREAMIEALRNSAPGN